MFTCDKCGARLADGMKYCDKCGSVVDENIEKTDDALGLNDIKPLDNNETNEKTKMKDYMMNIISYLPHSLSSKGDRTALMIGQGSIIALALIYIICFFAFMDEMCMPIAIKIVASYDGDFGGMTKGACSLWMVIYFMLNLYPAFIAVLSFFKRKYRMTALYSAIFFFMLTLFSLICWIVFEPSTIIESVDTYQKPGMIAWFALNDSLSEAWYLKMVLAISSVFGIGLDYIVNNGK